MDFCDGIVDIYRNNAVKPDSGFHDMLDDGIRAVIHKASQGTDWTDTKFKNRWERLKATSLLRGAYHFGEDADGERQADHFLAVVGPQPHALLCLDWETNDPRFGGTMLLGQAEAFVQRIREKTGKWPTLYSGESFLNAQSRRMKPTSPLIHCPLWLAKYSENAPEAPPVFKKRWAMWQYTSIGEIKGIAGACDRSRFYGSAEELRNFWNTFLAP